MPGLGGTKSKLSDTDKGDGSKPPPASRENPGQFHPQSSPTEAKRPSHYQPPVDPSSQSPDSDTSVSASRTSLPKDIAKDSDQGVASAVENPFVLREPLEGLERELDKIIDIISTEDQTTAAGSGSQKPFGAQKSLLDKFKSWRDDVVSLRSGKKAKL